jgi:hypothetical protein
MEFRRKYTPCCPNLLELRLTIIPSKKNNFDIELERDSTPVFSIIFEDKFK